MKSSHAFSVFLFSALATGLSACGGGGDSGDRSAGSSAGASRGAPSPVNTGLRVPTLLIPHTLSGAISLVQEVMDPYSKAEQARATKALASMVPGVGNASAVSPYGCRSGQIAFASYATGSLGYTYANCSDGTFTFNGASQVTPVIDTSGAVQSYELSFSGLQVSGPGGLDTTVSGSLSCTPAADGGQDPVCVSHFGGFFYGSDFTYDGNGTANGSAQCDSVADWLIMLNNFSATSGVAELFGPNGSAVVTRTGAKMFKVDILVDGAAYSYNVAL
jgi:hypothetical protein